MYNTIVCLIAQTNRLFNPEALQIIQVNSANYRRRSTGATGNGTAPNGIRSLQSESENGGIPRNVKKVAHSNKLNRSTMKTLQAMGHFDASGGVDKVLEGDEEEEETKDSEGKSQPHASDDGRKSERRSAHDPSEEGEDTFSLKPGPTFTNTGRGSMTREPSVSQNINYGDIYRGTSKDLDISGSSDQPLTPTARPSLLAGSSTYNLTSNPLAMANADGDGDGLQENRASLTARASFGADKGKPAARRTSVTMSGLGKTQQPINLKGRRKSVVK